MNDPLGGGSVRQVLISVLACALGLAVSAAYAFTVNTNLDLVDSSPGDGNCLNVGAQRCSLRAAIQEANDQGTPRTITLQSPGPYLLRLQEGDPADPDENAAATGDLDVSADLDVEAPAGTTRIIRVALNEQIGPPADRIFHVLAGGDLTLRDVSLEAGVATSASTFRGGAILVDPGGTLALFDCTLDGNDAWEGGAIYNEGTLDVDACTFSNNRALSTGGGAGEGGAIWSGDTGLTTVLRSTFTANRADECGGAIYGGFNAFVNLQNSTLSGNNGPDALCYEDINQSTLNHVTIAGNTGTGIATNLTNTILMEIASSIVSGSTGDNCVFTGAVAPGSLTSLSSDTSCGFEAGGGFDLTDPQLGGLADNGGTTLTHLPAQASPAVDNAAGGATCPNEDQRGVLRPDGDGGTGDCDIGAVELLPEPGGALLALVALAVVRAAARRRA